MSAPYNMRTEDFRTTAPGRLVSTTHGAMAFAPGPIPRAMSLDALATRLLADAERELGRLDALSRQGFNPYLLGRPMLQREAIVSSRIEGTTTTPDQLALFEAGSPPAQSRELAEAREVLNYVLAMEHARERLSDLPLSLRLIREIHGALMQGVRGSDQTPGEFRQAQNFIGRPGSSIHEARFVPPPVPEMLAALDDFEKYLHLTPGSDAALAPLLVRLALVHHQFETIHPFRDGNGRVGRLLIPLMLIEQGHLEYPLLYMSTYFERRRQEYYDQLLRLSQTGEYLPWITFFLAGVAESARDSVRQANRLLALRQEWHSRLAVARNSALLLRLVDHLFQRPALSVREAEKVLGLTYRSAADNIARLVEAGILEERTGLKKNRVFLATPLVRLMDTEPEVESNPS